MLPAVTIGQTNLETNTFGGRGAGKLKRINIK